jgi:hypothetical protein
LWVLDHPAVGRLEYGHEHGHQEFGRDIRPDDAEVLAAADQVGQQFARACSSMPS